MLEKPHILQIAHALARHASDRHAVIARNMANADTPGYRARDTVAFSDQLRSPAAMARTRPGHVAGPANSRQTTESIVAYGATSPNGNSVSVETEMMKSAETRHQHDMAVAVYKSSLDLLRTALGRGR